jgi:hypothetical protein
MSARIAPDALRDFAAAIFRAVGVVTEDARAWAETLVWANLRGVDSHGVLRIPRYIELIGTGAINPRPHMAMRMQAGAIGMLDADQAPGPVAMNRAMDEAIAIGRRLHLGWVVARDITHAGAVGHFALRAAGQGLAGLVMTASGPLMAWPGSAGAVVSTNPLAIPIPAATRPPLLLDMSTAAVALLDERGMRIEIGGDVADALGAQRLEGLAGLARIHLPQRHRHVQDELAVAALGRRVPGIAWRLAGDVAPDLDDIAGDALAVPPQQPAGPGADLGSRRGEAPDGAVPASGLKQRRPVVLVPTGVGGEVRQRPPRDILE